MANSVERLRVGLLVGAGLLVLVVAAFLGYAHYRAHRFVQGLPGRLGMDIRQETNAFTYSQTVEGRTIFTIHAAKAVQRNDNKVTLHDVAIVLYGRGGDRADKISGDEFEYDPGAQVMRAVGEVQIDLAAPAAADAKGKMDYAAGKTGAGGAASARMIHVKTRGLVFAQKLGEAATQEEIEFSSGGVTGHAKGAEYSSDTGVLELESAVEMTGLDGWQPVALTANHAELDRNKNLVTLAHARYRATGEVKGARTVEAEMVRVHLRTDGTSGTDGVKRTDGTVERVEGEGGVRLIDAVGAEVTAARGQVEMSGSNQPKTMLLTGGVRLVDQEALREAQGQAGEARAGFDTRGRVEQVVLTNAVQVQERVRATASAGWSEREVAGQRVELSMVPEGTKQTILHEVRASGGARMMASIPAKTGAKGGGSNAMRGDVLTAEFGERDGKAELRKVDGAGHTVLRRVSEAGAEDVSSGKTLTALFRGVAGTGVKAADAASKEVAGRVELVTAVQDGGVKIVHKGAADATTGAVAEEEASAKTAAYDAGVDEVTLTGGVQVSDAGSVLWADKVVARRGVGEATATGAVKASYLEVRTGAAKSPGGEPVHLTAARAEMAKATGVATFFGGEGRKARMWQGASQVEAPEIVFEQKARRVVARSAETGAGGAAAKTGPEEVRAVFVGGAGAGKKVSVVRVDSREMTYVDEARRADFSGGVKVQSTDGTMEGTAAQVFLKAAAGAAGQAGSSALFGGSVDKVVATGGIVIQQPGHKATGEKVVYTAGDGMFVLTGGPGAPPKVVDAERGTLSGDTLRLHAGDNSVVVLSDAAGKQRVDTETQVKKR